MKIGFLSTSAMKSYKDRPDFRNGDTRTVTDERYKHLCETFPLNFFPAGEMKQKLKSDKDAVAQAVEDLTLSAPAGYMDTQDGQSIGEHAAVDTSGLSEAEAKLYEIAVAKIDKGEDLSDDEKAVFDKVEAQTASADGD